MKRALLAAGAVVVAAALAAGGYVLLRLHQARDVHGSSTAQFTPGAIPLKTGTAVVPWPFFGGGPDRLHVAVGDRLAPPFRTVWTFRARSLVEFPPSIGYGNVYFANNHGTLFALRASSGRRLWTYVADRCQAMTPALAGGTVYATFLNHPPCNATGAGLDGLVVALSARTGAVLWQRTIEPSESSPVVVQGRVYIGDWSGRIYCLDAATGDVRWTFATGGKVKGAVTVQGGRVFVGSYDSHVYALDAATGKQLWRASAQPRLGATGTFYATPAVAYGRVYIGSTDGKEYSFAAATGQLEWSHSTGNYVYGSTAVWQGRVYVGSYSGSFFCFDAATGSELWSFRANGAISGSPTVLSGLVYFSTLARKTYALDLTSGKQVWTAPDGEYSPIVADHTRAYLVGYTRVSALVPR